MRAALHPYRRILCGLLAAYVWLFAIHLPLPLLHKHHSAFEVAAHDAHLLHHLAHESHAEQIDECWHIHWNRLGDCSPHDTGESEETPTVDHWIQTHHVPGSIAIEQSNWGSEETVGSNQDGLARVQAFRSICIPPEIGWDSLLNPSRRQPMRC